MTRIELRVFFNPQKHVDIRQRADVRDRARTRPRFLHLTCIVLIIFVPVLDCFARIRALDLQELLREVLEKSPVHVYALLRHVNGGVIRQVLTRHDGVQADVDVPHGTNWEVIIKQIGAGLQLFRSYALRYFRDIV